MWPEVHKESEDALRESFPITRNRRVLKQAFHSKRETRKDILLSSYFAAEYISLAEFAVMALTDSQQDALLIYMLITFLIVNTSMSRDATQRAKYSTKFEILEDLVGHHKFHEILQAHKYLNSDVNTPERHSIQEQRHVLNASTTELICSDGAVYDRARDPPGQRSVYIPPGNTQLESYRLSTYIKYPQEVPVNPRHLASAGFYYVGFKDRVKCFSCGLCVEDWAYGDDVKAAKWHRIDCSFTKGLNSGNVPIGGGGLARLVQAQPTQGPRDTTASPHGGARYNDQERGITQTASQSSRPPTNTLEFATIPSAYHENFLKNLDLRKESERLRTYEHWPSERPTVIPNDLARSGFFYLGNLDRVQCFSCAGVLRNWNYGDVVNNEHRRHFPHCRLVQGAEQRNVPMTSDERAAAPQQQIVFHEPPDPSENEKRDLQNMFQCRHPVSPHMRNVDARLQTFDRRWEINNINTTPRQIARAGFFYLGERDRVKCWYCNGGLQNFDPEDEPWTEHAKWFPTCEFLLQKKGPDFVHRMVSMFPNLPRPLLRGGIDVPPQERNNSGHRGAREVEGNSHPVQIIDPQEDLRREEQRLDELMQSDVAQAAVEMGFDRRLIRRLIKRRIQQSDMYTRVASIIDDVMAEGTLAPGNEAEDEMETITGEEDLRSQVESIDEETSPSMQNRIEELRAERMCRICRRNPSDLVLVPCGHLCSCANCSPQRCPLCNRKVEKSIRAYIT